MAHGIPTPATPSPAPTTTIATTTAITEGTAAAGAAAAGALIRWLPRLNNLRVSEGGHSKETMVLFRQTHAGGRTPRGPRRLKGPTVASEPPASRHPFLHCSGAFGLLCQMRSAVVAEYSPSLISSVTKFQLSSRFGIIGVSSTVSATPNLVRLVTPA